MTDHYDRLRRPLTHWTILDSGPDEDGNIVESYRTFIERGDAYLEMWQAKRPMGGEFYEAWVKLVTAQLDRYVDEARCKETGGHVMEEWGDFGDQRCVKCLHVEWSEHD